MTVEPEGRGAWTTRGKDNDSIWYRFVLGDPLDGHKPSPLPEGTEAMWYDRIRRGVCAIQQLLTIHGYPKSQTGLYDLETRRLVSDYQQSRGLVVDGTVGMQTMKQMMNPVIISAAISGSFHPRWLYAHCRQESGFDPAAQGELNWPDSGLFQFNLEAHPDLSLNDVYNPVKAARMASRRFRAALDKYKGKGPELRFDCAIAQHNSPAWADQWFASGSAPSDKIADYVADVRGWSEEWVD
jgi:hypothetical protein